MWFFSGARGRSKPRPFSADRWRGREFVETLCAQTSLSVENVSITAKELTMQYLLMIYRDEKQMLAASKENSERTMAAYAAYTEAMKKAGVYVGGNRLQPTTTATTVRNPNGKASVLDGPFAETKEQLGGYYLIDAPDLDAALSWAARCPGAAQGAIEVRAIWER
jgi:hypothetical protein